MKVLSNLTAEDVKNILVYEPDTGIFRYRNKAGQGGRIPAMTRAGFLNKERYRTLRIKRVCYRASRIAWLYVYGEWPKGQIDHINRNTGDDRIENLRDVTQSENKLNCRTYKNNTSGCPNVSYDKSAKGHKKWSAFRREGLNKRKRIGWFYTKEEAVVALELYKASQTRSEQPKEE